MITGAPLQTPRMTGPPVAMMDRAQMATSQSHPLQPQSEPSQQGPPGAVIPQKRLGEHTASIGRTLANQLGGRWRINWADVGESEPESSGTQASVPRANLGTRVMRSSRQGERETDLKKASRTPANNSGKRNLAVMQEADKPYGSEGSPGPQRKVARQVGAIDAGIEVELAHAMGSII